MCLLLMFCHVAVGGLGAQVSVVLLATLLQTPVGFTNIATQDSCFLTCHTGVFIHQIPGVTDLPLLVSWADRTVLVFTGQTSPWISHP